LSIVNIMILLCWSMYYVLFVWTWLLVLGWNDRPESQPKWESDYVLNCDNSGSNKIEYWKLDHH